MSEQREPEKEPERKARNKTLWRNQDSVSWTQPGKEPVRFKLCQERRQSNMQKKEFKHTPKPPPPMTERTKQNKLSKNRQQLRLGQHQRQVPNHHEESLETPHRTDAPKSTSRPKTVKLHKPRDREKIPEARLGTNPIPGNGLCGLGGRRGGSVAAANEEGGASGVSALQGRAAALDLCLQRGSPQERRRTKNLVRQAQPEGAHRQQSCPAGAARDVLRAEARAHGPETRLDTKSAALEEEQVQKENGISNFSHQLV